MMENDHPGRLKALQTKIAAVLALKPQCFITHPSELAVFRRLRAHDLRDFAERNGWRLVRRVGGRQIEFYNDATVRPGFVLESPEDV